MRTRIQVENGEVLPALQGFLQSLLTEGIVDLILVPMRTPHGAVAPALVSDPALLVHADPLAPVLPVNAATLAGQVSVRKPRPRVAAVLRSCELRALVELVKLQQASLEDMLLIAVDCAGAYSVPVYLRRASEPELWLDLFTAAGHNPETPPEGLRQACQMCERPVYDRAQVGIELFGNPLDREIGLTLPDDLGEKLGYLAAEETSGREQVLARLVTARQSRLDSELSAIRARLEGPENLPGVFAACIRCHNCMTVCPICYCKTCVFKSQVFDHEPMQYLAWTRQKGAYRLPADTTLFHLTRLNHMALSCVGCGMCTEACPSELPVGLVFRAIGQRVQATFDYLPGRDLEEKLPLVTFKADEWTEVGE